MPVPEYHCGTRTHTRVSTWLGTRTRTHTHFIVPIPEYPLWYPYPCFNMAWHPYSYPYPFHCTRTRVSTWLATRTRTHTHFIVPVPEYLFWYPYPYLVPDYNSGNMMNIELKLKITKNFDNLPCISACCPKTVRNIKLKYFLS